MTDKNSSSPAPGGFATLGEEIAYYKRQYEQLELELQDFQASSKELEAELEKDVEASEKRERQLKEKVESVQYEANEWKAKYKQAKQEANTAQNNLQKEITTLRDSNRTLQLKLRDIEVANDDFERQARNTTSSLEDMESRYNVALERGVMLEEEIKNGEQERELLRIEAQRLRDELSDLKVEAEITQEKLRTAESANSRYANRVSQYSEAPSQPPKSPTSDGSFKSLSTNPTGTPPPIKSDSSVVVSETQTPPSPPLSDAQTVPKTFDPNISQSPAKKQPLTQDAHATPRPEQVTTAKPRHTRGPSLAAANGATPSFRRVTNVAQRPALAGQEALPRSGSLYQIRGLIGKMQKLEQRVQSVKSKLPAPTTTPPRASPRGTTNVGSGIPGTVTVRSNKKRTSGSAANFQTPSRTSDDTPSRHGHRSSRISFGMPPVGDESSSRPQSRASNASNGSFARPASRASLIGSRTGGENYYHGSIAESRRPRSSLSGSVASSHVSQRQQNGVTVEEEDNADDDVSTPTPRRTTLDRNGFGSSAIPMPSGTIKSLGSSMIGRGTPGRRQSSSVKDLTDGSMAPPERRKQSRASGVGETF